MADVPERTLAVLFAPQGPLYRTEIEQHLLQAGFTIVAGTEVVGEELEEAGLELGLGTGGEEGEQGGVEADALHVALVLERVAAVKGWKELLGEGAGALNSRSIAVLYPTLKVHGSPSASAATMSISTLFSNLPEAPSLSPSTPTEDLDASFTSEPSPSHASIRPKPFALSNLALPTPQTLTNKLLSPSIERALAKLENEEEQKRLSSASDGSNESTPPSVEDPNRRVFTFRSRETTEEHVEDELEQEYESEEGPAVAYDYDYSEEEVEILSEPAKLEQQHRERATSTSTTTSHTSFRARPAPSSTTSAPQPRLTKSAALRLGVALPSRAPRPSSPPKNPPRAPVVPPKSLNAPSIAPRSTKSSALRTGEASGLTPATKVRREAAGTAERNANPVFENTPGLKRRESIQVASTARPKIEVRMTKGAALRAGVEVPTVLTRVDSTSSIGSRASEGQKRRESIVVKSTAPPRITPRGTKSSALRAGTDSPTIGRGTPLERLAEREEGGHGFKRRESIQVVSSARPAFEPSMTKSALLRAGIEAPAPRRTSTVAASFEGVPGHRRRESITVASSRPPIITPRLTRTTLLRQTSDPLSIPRSSSILARPATLAPPPPPRAASALSATSAPARPPTIAPRSNRSAELRAAKKVAEAAAQTKVGKKKGAPTTLRIGTSKALSELTPNGGDSPRGSPLSSGFGEVRSDGTMKDGN